jgi:hypothetical protein
MIADRANPFPLVLACVSLIEPFLVKLPQFNLKNFKLSILSYLVPSLEIYPIAYYCVALLFFKNYNLPSFCVRWDTIHTAPSRTTVYV